MAVTMIRGTHRAFAPIAGAVCAGVMLTACSSSAGKGAAPAPTSSAPTPTATSAAPSPTADPTAAAKQGALAAYRGMWEVTTKAYTAGSLTGITGLETYARDKALSNILITTEYYEENNLVAKGAPVLSPEARAVDLTGVAPRVVIRDCVDTSNFQSVNKTTGVPVATDGRHRQVLNAVAHYLDGRWVISEAAFDREQTC